VQVIIQNPKYEREISVRPYIIERAEATRLGLAAALQKPSSELPLMTSFLRILGNALRRSADDAGNVTAFLLRHAFVDEMINLLRLSTFLDMLTTAEQFKMKDAFAIGAALSPDGIQLHQSLLDRAMLPRAGVKATAPPATKWSASNGAWTGEFIMRLIQDCIVPAGPELSQDEAVSIVAQSIRIPVATAEEYGLARPLHGPSSYETGFITRLWELLRATVEDQTLTRATIPSPTPGGTVTLRAEAIRVLAAQVGQLLVLPAWEMGRHLSSWLRDAWGRPVWSSRMSDEMSRAVATFLESAPEAAGFDAWTELTDTTRLESSLLSVWPIEVPEPAKNYEPEAIVISDVFIGDLSPVVTPHEHSIQAWMDAAWECATYLGQLTHLLAPVKEAAKAISPHAQSVAMAWPESLTTPILSGGYPLVTDFDGTVMIRDSVRSASRLGLDPLQAHTLGAIRAKAACSFHLVQVHGADDSRRLGGMKPLLPVRDQDAGLDIMQVDPTLDGLLLIQGVSYNGFASVIKAAVAAGPASQAARSLAHAFRFAGLLVFYYSSPDGTPSRNPTIITPWESHWYHETQVPVGLASRAKAVALLRPDDEAILRFLQMERREGAVRAGATEGRGTAELWPFEALPAACLITLMPYALAILKPELRREDTPMVLWASGPNEIASELGGGSPPPTPPKTAVTGEASAVSKEGEATGAKVRDVNDVATRFLEGVKLTKWVASLPTIRDFVAISSGGTLSRLIHAGGDPRTAFIQLGGTTKTLLAAREPNAILSIMGKGAPAEYPSSRTAPYAGGPIGLLT
jgi:hypothetical protein